MKRPLIVVPSAVTLNARLLPPESSSWISGVPVYPGAQFTPATNPKLYEAAKVLLKWRGDGSTGWSFGWRMPL